MSPAVAPAALDQPPPDRRGLRRVGAAVARASAAVSVRALPWSSAFVPLGVSLAANVRWGALTGSPTLVAAGVVTPLLLVLAIERWRALPDVDSAGVWWVRTLAMAGVVLVVAGWSWLHTTSLLLDEVERVHPAPPRGSIEDPVRAVIRVGERVLCVLAPLAVDGLAVLSVLALRRPGEAKAGDRPVARAVAHGAAFARPISLPRPPEPAAVRPITAQPAQPAPEPAAQPPTSPSAAQAESPRRATGAPSARPTVVPPAEGGRPATPARASDDELVAKLQREVDARGFVPGRDEVKRILGCGSAVADRVRVRVHAPQPLASTNGAHR